MGRREPDERPPIEILGADLGVSSTQQVALGPRRPKPGRGRTLAIAAAVVAVLVGGLALGGSRRRPEATPRRSATTSERPRQAAPPPPNAARRPHGRPRRRPRPSRQGPPLGAPVEGALLLYSGSGWRAVDLDDRGDPGRQPARSPMRTDAVTVEGGIVLPWSAARPSSYPVLGGGDDPKPPMLGPADAVLRGGPDRVWLVDMPPEGTDEPNPQIDVRLVDLDGEVLPVVPGPGPLPRHGHRGRHARLARAAGCTPPTRPVSARMAVGLT